MVEFAFIYYVEITVLKNCSILYYGFLQGRYVYKMAFLLMFTRSTLLQVF